MGAASAHHRVIAVFQTADKGVTPGGFCHGLHLGVGGRRAAHADVLPNALVKEVVVLGDKGHLVIELLQWDPLQVLSAQGDGAGGYIPKAGDQLGDGGLARARGPHKGGHAPGGNGEGHIVEHLLVRVVAERHMGELDVPAPELHRRFPVILLRPVQDGVHRAHDGAHFGKAVHKVHSGQQRPGNAQGQDDGGDKGLDGQTPSGIEEPAHRQNGDHGGGRDGTGQRDRHLAALHPVVEVGGVGLYAVGEAGIGLLALVERLDDLNAADVLHNGAVHGLGGLDRALILLAVASHHRHHESHAHRDGHHA